MKSVQLLWHFARHYWLQIDYIDLDTNQPKREEGLNITSFVLAARSFKRIFHSSKVVCTLQRQ